MLGLVFALLRLDRRQDVPAAPQLELAEHVQAHERQLDVLPGVPAGERRHDHGPVPGHAVGEQRQHIRGDPFDRGVEVGGGCLAFPALPGWFYQPEDVNMTHA
jgi:hypothetical protein